MSSGREVREVACRGCGITFQSQRKNVVYCSDTCRIFGPKLRWSDPHCYVCGAGLSGRDPESNELLSPERYWRLHSDFEPTHRACLRELVDREEGEARRACSCKSCQLERGERYHPGLPGLRSARGKRRPARSPEYLRHRKAVLERDDWTCQICWLPLDPDASMVDDLYPQADHITPVALGGDDGMENLRAAHRWCNWALGDSLVVTERGVRTAAHVRFASRFPAELIARAASARRSGE
ncbi:HNH endonuclease [Terrabacter tumescens]|uniref:HNH endonuclease n=1 Tax=Terrabacter tumescens TaxID=60443 RepID=UPI0009DDACCB